MTPEELKEIEDRYNSLVNDEAVKENLLREMCIAIVDAGKLLAHIKELESQIPRWIPVEERLPGDGEKVLACARGVGMVVLRFEIDGSEKISPWCTGFYTVDCIWVKDITHWMPLPKEPEE